MPASAAVYARRRRAGLCTRCGEAPALPGQRDCERCHYMAVDPNRCGVPLEQALPERDHEPMRHFLRWLTTAARRAPTGTRLDISKFINAYREIYGLPHAEKQWVATQE